MPGLIEANAVPVILRDTRNTYFYREKGELSLSSAELFAKDYYLKDVALCRSDVVVKILKQKNVLKFDTRFRGLGVVMDESSFVADPYKMYVGLTLDSKSQVNLPKRINRKALDEVAPRMDCLKIEDCWDSTAKYDSVFVRKLNLACADRARLEMEKFPAGLNSLVEVHELRHLADYQRRGVFGREAAYDKYVSFAKECQELGGMSKFILKEKVQRFLQLDWSGKVVDEMAAISEETRMSQVNKQGTLEYWRILDILGQFRKIPSTGKSQIEEDFGSLEFGESKKGQHYLAALAVLSGEDLCCEPEQIMDVGDLFDKRKLFGPGYVTGWPPTKAQMEYAKDKIIGICHKRLSDLEEGVPVSLAFVERLILKTEEMIKLGYAKIF